METSGDFVSTRITTEFSSCVQHREYDFEGWLFGRRMHIDRNATTIVFDTHRSILFQNHNDMVTVTRHRFINRVIDDFVHTVMKSALIGRTDVHTGALPDRL